jgi:hypothetical protein
MDVDDNIESSIVDYPFDENSYLDPQFLTSMGNKEDRGLAAEGLRLVQLDTDTRSLNKWEQRLTKLEAFVHQERIKYMAKRTALQKTKDDIHRRLRAAKARTHIARNMAVQYGESLPFQTTRQQTHQERIHGCHWCERSGLWGHKDKDCEQPHIRCTLLKPQRCLVPNFHSGYHSYLETNGCLYAGDHKGKIP